MSDDASIQPGVRALLAATLLALASAVAWALVSVPSRGAGLWPQVDEHLAHAGAANPVTAVLLNFRAYDTLLEIAVLTIALLAIWSLREAPEDILFAPPGPVLRRVVATLVPLMVLIAGYLLWAGTSRSGGAFPAGAVASAALVLVMLADIDASRTRASVVRVGMVTGLLTFVSVGLAGLFWGLNFLEYPTHLAAPLIVLVESAGAVSIALILAGVFAGSARPLTRAHSPSAPTASAPNDVGSQINLASEQEPS